MPPFRIYYRIGIAGEKKVLLNLPEKAYYGVCFGANAAIFGRTWVSQYVNLSEKPFFIDPMTYVFQFSKWKNSKEDSVPKKSFKMLSEKIGDPISSAVSSGSLVSRSDFSSDTIESTVRNILNFQENIAIPGDGSQRSFDEFGEWLGETSPKRRPEFLVVPYFWFDSHELEWYDLNLDMIHAARGYSQGRPIYAVICTDLHTISKEEWRSKIVLDFNMADGILLWISGFDEYKVPGNHLIDYLELIRSIQKRNEKTVIMMYGSYFSMIASKYGLFGMAPGIGMSESKSIREQATGGTFSKRYYISQTKSSVIDANARSFYAANPGALCTCDICTGKVGESILDSEGIHQFFSRLTPLEAKKHYCMCKALELEEIERSNIDGIRSILLSNINFCEEKKTNFYGIKFKHLARWYNAIRGG